MDERLFDKYHITKTTMLDAALSYAAQGLAVFPLEAQGKKPITKHGLKDATTNLDTVRAMFTAYPFSNIGMACGKQSGGVVVVDIDIDDEKGTDGNDSLREWERDHGELPETAMTLTGRGGNHYIYRTKGLTKSRIACKEGIDIRADGGYIVLPPSIHPNGTQYTWEYDISEYGIQQADKSVIDLMNEGVETGTEFKVPETIPSGERNGTLYKLACSMQSRGNGDDAIKAAVFAENKARCNPPLPEEEVEKLIESALKKPKGTSPYNEPSKGVKKETGPLVTYTMNEIQSMHLKPPDFLVDKILPKGVCLLGAPPKIGKSWMALDIGIQCAQGGEFLGHRCRKCGVLYLALEDSLYRLQERAMKLTQGDPVPDNLYFAIDASKVDPGDKDDGLYKQLEDMFDKHEDIELVIIDTLQMVTPSKRQGDDAYASTYTLLNSIRPFWQERQIGFLLVHHTRKKSINDVDPFETFLGSQGLTGATDGMYIIQSKKDMDFCDFYGRGRDFEDVTLAIRRNGLTCRWESIGDPEDIQAERERNAYRRDPVVRYLKWMLEEANGIPQEFRCTELRKDIADKYQITVATSDRNLGTKLKELEPKLALYDGIKLTCQRNTTRKNLRGTFYRIEYIDG